MLLLNKGGRGPEQGGVLRRQVAGVGGFRGRKLWFYGQRVWLYLASAAKEREREREELCHPVCTGDLPVMLSVSRFTERGPFFRAMPVAGFALCLSVCLSGCKLVDQKTFNAQAGKPPVPYIPPAPPGPPPVPPLVELVAGTPSAEWTAPVGQVVHKALARKPDILFVVKCLVPPGADPATDQQALVQLVQGDGQAVTQAIIKAGASPAQVEMAAMPDSTVTKSVVRVYVK